MKIAIISDFHIGYERFYEDAYIQAKNALDLAASMADALIIPGDVFDKRNPKPEVLAQAINIFRELKQRHWSAHVVSFSSANNTKIHTNIPIIAIPGTHERTAEGKENPLTLLSLAGLLVDNSESVVTIKKDDECVSIFALGGLSEEMVKPRLKELDPKPVPNNFNIFMFHQSTYELLPFSEHFIHNDELPQGYDLYVNGHIHNKVIDKIHNKDFLIPGSTVLTQLKDGEQEEKGFFIYDTVTKTFDFIKIKSRPFTSIRIKIDSVTPKKFSETLEYEISSVIEKYLPEKPIIKVNVSGNIEKGFKRLDMPIRSILVRFEDKVYLEIETKDLVDAETEKQIADIQEGKMYGQSIKEYGSNLFRSKLTEHGFDININVMELFAILCSSKKERALKEANEFFDKISNPISS